MNRAFLAVLGGIALFGFALAQTDDTTCTDSEINELSSLLPRVQSCIASICRVVQNESACACCSRIQGSSNPTPAEVSCCEMFTTSNSLYKQCKDRLMGATGKSIDPGVVLEIVKLALQLGLQICKIINSVINNAGASVQGIPILGLLLIGIGSLGVFFL